MDYNCPGCQTEWFRQGTQERVLVQKFLGEVEPLKSSLQGRDFKLKTEIARPE